MSGDPLPGDSRKRLGQQGEEWVANALQERGFRLLQRNYRSRWGEIDLIVERGNVLWFVEVKTRRGRARGQVDVSDFQKRRLTRMAYAYLCAIQKPYEIIQFVVAAVYVVEGDVEIEFIEQAFEGAF